jgi:hypothetical protein
VEAALDGPISSSLKSLTATDQKSLVASEVAGLA